MAELTLQNCLESRRLELQMLHCYNKCQQVQNVQRNWWNGTAKAWVTWKRYGQRPKSRRSEWVWRGQFGCTPPWHKIAQDKVKACTSMQSGCWVTVLLHMKMSSKQTAGPPLGAPCKEKQDTGALERTLLSKLRLLQQKHYNTFIHSQHALTSGFSPAAVCHCSFQCYSSHFHVNSLWRGADGAPLEHACRGASAMSFPTVLYHSHRRFCVTHKVTERRDHTCHKCKWTPSCH